MKVLLIVATCLTASIANADAPADLATEIATRPSLYDLYPPTNPTTVPADTPGFKDPERAAEEASHRQVTEIPGEQIDPRSGELVLSASDLVVPGNGGMDIVVSRTRRGSFFSGLGETYLRDRSFQDTIGDWRLDIPHIRVASINTFHVPNATDPVIYTPLTSLGACSYPYPPDPSVIAPINPALEQLLKYFRGVEIGGLPGVPSKELLLRDELRVEYLDETYATADHWIARCAGSQYFPGTAGKFIAHSPDGYTYTFDEPTIGNNLGTPPVTPVNPVPYFGHMRIFVNRIEDRNGNWLQYEYDNSLFPHLIPKENPPPGGAQYRDYAYVKRIYSSDGREVTFQWECNPFSAGGGGTDCPLNTALAHGAPIYRLKSFSYAGRTWQYRYNDSTTGSNKSRYLSQVILPNGQSWNYTASTGSATLETCDGYPYSTGGGQPVNYQVSFPDGAVVDYTMTTRRFIRDNVCWYDSAVKTRTVNDLSGAAGITNWCYSTISQGTTSPWRTYVLAPNRFDAFAFDREGSDGKNWQEGLLLQQQTRPPVATCPGSIGDPGAGYLSKTAYEYTRGPKIIDLHGGEGTHLNLDFRYIPDYPQSIIAPRVMSKRTIDQPLAGAFELTTGNNDVFSIPQLTRESLVNAPSTATDARRWLTRYDHRAARLFNFGEKLNWIAPANTRVDVWYRAGAGADQLGRSNQTNWSGDDPWVLDSLNMPQGVPYTFSLYPKGDHNPNQRIVSLTITRNTTGYPSDGAYRWVLQPVARHCAISLETAIDCPLSSGIVQGEVSTYDPLSNKLSESDFGKTKSYQYDAQGNVTQISDERQNVTVYSNYLRGIPQLVQLPGTDGAQQTAVINPTGSVHSITNALGRTTTFQYDLRDRLSNVHYPIGLDMNIIWSAEGRTKTMTHGTAASVSDFDGLGRLLRENASDTLRGEHIIKSYDYDDVGRMSFESYPASVISSDGLRYAYDALDRRIRTTRTIDSTYTESTFVAPEGKNVRDFRGTTTAQSYRSFGAPSYEQLMSSSTPYTATDANGNATPTVAVTAFLRDVFGFANRVTQGGIVRRYELNAKRLLTKELAPELGPRTAPDGNFNNMGYCRDDAGNVTGKSIGTDCASAASAQLLSNQYDARNRVSSVDYKDSTSRDISIYYTPTDKPNWISKGTVAIELGYDETENLKTETFHVDQYAFKLIYGYDGLHHVSSMTYPSGKTYALSPDAWGRPRGFGSVLQSVDYYPTGQIHTLSYVNGQTTTYDLTTLKQVGAIHTQSSTLSVVNLGYGYDANSNVIAATDALHASDNQTLQYDELNRLIMTQYPGKTGEFHTYRRGYDPTGNVQFDQTLEQSLTFAYSANNRLQTVGGTLSRNLNYDDLGNMTSDGARSLQFGYDSTLTQATAPVAKTFTYDGRNRVIREDGTSGSTYFVYSGEKLMLEYKPAQQVYTEYFYLGGMLIGSRSVTYANTADSDGDGVSDANEFLDR